MWKFVHKIKDNLTTNYYVDETLEDFCVEHGRKNFSYKLKGDYDSHSYEYRYINGVPYNFELIWKWESDNSKRTTELFKIYSPDWIFTWVSRGLFSNTLMFYIDELVDNISLETVESDMMSIVLLSDQL
jgi:hypothetical protein